MIVFLILLHSNTPRKESCDRLSCSLKGSGVFTVCSVFILQCTTGYLCSAFSMEEYLVS